MVSEIFFKDGNRFVCFFYFAFFNNYIIASGDGCRWTAGYLRVISNYQIVYMASDADRYKPLTYWSNSSFTSWPVVYNSRLCKRFVEVHNLLYGVGDLDVDVAVKQHQNHWVVGDNHLIFTCQSLLVRVSFSSKYVDTIISETSFGVMFECHMFFDLYLAAREYLQVEFHEESCSFPLQSSAQQPIWLRYGPEVILFFEARWRGNGKPVALHQKSPAAM